MESGDAQKLGWNLLREDLSLPAAVLYRSRLEHNLAWMRRFTDAYGVRLAPHGKTTMAPRLFAMQMEAGAWGITLATAQQTLVTHAHGVRRVLMANELVGKENMAMISRVLRDPEFEFYCLVDSAALVEQLGRFFAAQGQRLQVLMELGVSGGRAGVRDPAQLSQTLDALGRWKDVLRLDGVEIYEGVLDNERAIRAFAQRAVVVTKRLMAEQWIQRRPALLTGAGSAWYDVIAEEFSVAELGDEVEIVLRPGCYLTHDAGSYERAQKRIRVNNPVACGMDSGLETALHIWAYVQSIPETERAIVGMGRRDAAFDSGLPVPRLHYRPGESRPKPSPQHWEVTKLMDQHAYLRVAPEDDVQVGDMIGFDICHPCLTFDKWRVLPVVDEDYNVMELVETFF
jgi:D-serine dehydratase